MKLTFTDKKHGFVEGITNEGVIYKMPADGLVIFFDAKDVVSILDANYPRSENGWWFNETKDREIAERRGEEVVCNPQVLWRHFDWKN